MDTPNPGNQSQQANVPTPSEPSAPTSSAQDRTRKTLLFTYVLYVMGLFVALVTVTGLIVAYIKRKDAQGTWMESHFTWLIRTFWIYVGFYVLGLIIIVLLPAMPVQRMWIILSAVILLDTMIWYIYRLIKGFLYFIINKPLY